MRNWPALGAQIGVSASLLCHFHRAPTARFFITKYVAWLSEAEHFVSFHARLRKAKLRITFTRVPRSRVGLVYPLRENVPWIGIFRIGCSIADRVVDRSVLGAT